MSRAGCFGAPRLPKAQVGACSSWWQGPFALLTTVTDTNDSVTVDVSAA